MSDHGSSREAEPLFHRSTKSLFRNILRISPSRSRFCEGKSQITSRKFFESNILAMGARKKLHRRIQTTPAFSIFCP
jgi:hypothetical protein